MKITIDIEISDEVMAEAVKDPAATQKLVAAIATNINLKLKADAAKILIEFCKQLNIPLEDLLSS